MNHSYPSPVAILGARRFLWWPRPFTVGMVEPGAGTAPVI